LLSSAPTVAWHDTCSGTLCGPDGRRFRTRQLLTPARQSSTDVRMTMLWTLFVVLLLLWLLGVVSSYTLGGFIHILLVLAVVAVLVQLITGRRAV
jgi:hypothetical protein